MYQYPRLEGPGAIIASRSFYRADSVTFSWNKKGSVLRGREIMGLKSFSKFSLLAPQVAFTINNVPLYTCSIRGPIMLILKFWHTMDIGRHVYNSHGIL